MLLRSVAWREGDEAPAGHPFDVPVVRALAGAPLAFTTPATFLVGENGTGKSTLLEAIACAAEVPAAGALPTARDPSLAAARALADRLRLTWSRRSRAGAFVRAEDVFGFAQHIDRARAESEAEIAAIRADATLSPRQRGFAAMPHAREAAALRERYGDGLDARSHGEAFLTLLAPRLAAGGLLLLDEPEAPLSPTRQLTLLSLLMAAAASGRAQLVVATHSPIVMALPGATILLLGDGPARPVAWADVEHVRVTRDFLNAPETFLRHLG